MRSTLYDRPYLILGKIIANDPFERWSATTLVSLADAI